MSFSSGSREQMLAQLADPRPSGTPIGAYATYREAQRAIDYLSDEKFPVEHTTIVGKDLQRVEKITGRLNTGRAVALGAASGAYIGLFFGIFISLLDTGVGFFISLLTGLVLGAVMGAIFGLIGYALSRGQRDFTSSTVVIATTYEVLCDSQVANDARNLLAKLALTGQVHPLTVDQPGSYQPADAPSPATPSHTDAAEPGVGTGVPSDSPTPAPDAGTDPDQR